MEQGRIHIYYGNGKGKTTAGVGLCVRAAGAGKKVLFYQFMKDNSTSERISLSKIPNITMTEGLSTEKFSFQMTEQEKAKRKAYYEKQWNCLVEQAEEKQYDLLFADEIIYTIAAGLMEEEIVLSYLRNKPPHLEIVLTGNPPSQALLSVTDYATEMKKIRHPYDKGEAARYGIEK